MTFGLFVLMFLMICFIYLGFHFVHHSRHLENGRADATLAMGCFCYAMATILFIASAMLYVWGVK